MHFEDLSAFERQWMESLRAAPPGDCPPRETLHQMVEGRLAASDFQSLMLHVSACRSCFASLQELRALRTAREPLARATYRVQHTVESGQPRLNVLRGAVREASRRVVEQIWARPGPALAWGRQVVSEGAESAGAILEPAQWGDLQVLAQVSWEPDGFALHLALVQRQAPEKPVPHCQVILWRKGEEVDRATSSEEGFVDFYGLAADTYGLTFGTAPGWLWEVELHDAGNRTVGGPA